MIPIEHIHPILVHFPIVFFLTLTVLDIVAVFAGRSVTGRGAMGNVSAGLAVLAALFSMAAFALGDEALEIAEATGFRSDIAETHEGLGTAVVAFFSIWALIRAFMWLKNTSLTGGVKWLIPLVETAGTALILATAYYGGILVYDLGVNVTKLAQ